MVCKGNIIVTLVDAQTRKKFKEHVADNRQIYVEVEPEVEYFIHAKNNTTSTVVVDAKVNDQDLGYISEIGARCSTLMGLWSTNNSSSTETALRFKKIDQRPIQDNDKDYLMSLIGHIEVNVFEHICTWEKTKKRKKEEDVMSKWKDDDPKLIKLARNLWESKKFVESGKGEFSITTKLEYCDFKAGRFLDKISLNYCTAAGLMEVGILRQPSFNAQSKNSAARIKNSPNKSKLNIEPKIVINDIKDADGNIIRKEKTEYFDLINLSDSDSSSN